MSTTTTTPTTPTPPEVKAAPISLTPNAVAKVKGNHGATESRFRLACAWGWWAADARASPTPCSSTTARA